MIFKTRVLTGVHKPQLSEREEREGAELMGVGKRSLDCVHQSRLFEDQVHPKARSWDRGPFTTTLTPLSPPSE